MKSNISLFAFFLATKFKSLYTTKSFSISTISPYPGLLFAQSIQVIYASTLSSFKNKFLAVPLFGVNETIFFLNFLTISIFFVRPIISSQAPVPEVLLFPIPSGAIIPTFLLAKSFNPFIFLGFPFLTKIIALLKYKGSIIFGFLYAPLVITGIHHTTNAVEFTLIQQLGGTMIFPLLALSNISQATASLAMSISSKEVKKDVAIPAAISAYLGVTEPALYGVNIKYKYPMICAMIASACGAGICGFFGVMANSIGVGGLPGILTVKPQYWLVYLVAMIVTISVTFISTFIFTKKKSTI